MRRVALLAMAMVTTATIAGLMAQQTTPSSPLDPTMNRIGPTTGAAIKAMLAMAYADSRTQLAEVRKGLVDTEAYFSGARRQDGVKFAREALARLDAFDKTLASAVAVMPAPPAESPFDAPMKRVGPAIAAAGKAIASGAYADAQTQVATARAGLMEAESFFASRKTDAGVKFAKEALARLAALDKELTATNVDRGAAQAVLKELNGACAACHAMFRIRDEKMNFVLRPGSAPTPELATAQTALRGLQGACSACHMTYRTEAHGEWVLRSGS